MDVLSQHTDEELFMLIAEGDENSFRLLFHRYVPQFEPLIASIIQSEAEVKDVMQEVFLRVWMSRDRLLSIETPRAWLFKIVYYQCYSWIRQKAVRDRAKTKLTDQQDADYNNNEVEELLTLEETGKLITQAIEQLTPQGRKIYSLSRHENLTVAEIADKLELSVQTVKNTLSTALKSIRVYLEQRGVILPIIFLWNCFF